MAEAKHTPGPWTYVGRLGFGHLVRALGQGPALSSIAVAYGGAASGRESDGEANARLIAAAPELLSALADALDMWAGDAEELDGAGRHNAAINVRSLQKQMRAAIAKATGGGS